MPINRKTQEVFNVYLSAGTRDRIREWLGEDESLSGFIRTALERELTVRTRRAAREEAKAAAS